MDTDREPEGNWGPSGLSALPTVTFHLKERDTVPDARGTSCGLWILESLV